MARSEEEGEEEVGNSEEDGEDDVGDTVGTGLAADEGDADSVDEDDELHDEKGDGNRKEKEGKNPIHGLVAELHNILVVVALVVALVGAREHVKRGKHFYIIQKKMCEILIVA